MRRHNVHSLHRNSILLDPPPQSSHAMFKLHIWGPAFNLPSIDPECIAAIALLNDVLAYDEWLLVIDHDPSASPSSTSLLSLPSLQRI